MKKTTNYQLNQWDKSDRIQMEDFNSDNAKIEAALTAQAEILSEAVSKMGNCSITHSSYTGTGTYGSSSPNKITFPKRPLIALVRGNSSFMILFGEEDRYPLAMWSNSSGVAQMDYSWNGNTISYYRDLTNPAYQFNTSGVIYDVYALYSET